MSLLMTQRISFYHVKLLNAAVINDENNKMVCSPYLIG